MLDRVCTLCGSGAVQDEKHVLLECRALEDVRVAYSDLLASCNGSMQSLLNSGSTSQLAWFVHKCMKQIDIVFDRV